MIDIDDIPDDTEFNRTFKKKFKEAVRDGKNSFEFVVGEDGKCCDVENAPGIQIEQHGPLRILKFPNSK